MRIDTAATRKKDLALAEIEALEAKQDQIVADAAMRSLGLLIRSQLAGMVPSATPGRITVFRMTVNWGLPITIARLSGPYDKEWVAARMESDPDFRERLARVGTREWLILFDIQGWERPITGIVGAMVDRPDRDEPCRRTSRRRDGGKPAGAVAGAWADSSEDE